VIRNAILNPCDRQFDYLREPYPFDRRERRHHAQQQLLVKAVAMVFQIGDRNRIRRDGRLSFLQNRIQTFKRLCLCCSKRVFVSAFPSEPTNFASTGAPALISATVSSSFPSQLFGRLSYVKAAITRDSFALTKAS
jgi:hypothetical protein